MAITPADPITISTSEDSWVEVLVTDLSGVPTPGLTLSDISVWYAKQNASSLVSKSLTPGVDLLEVGRGLYRIQFSDTDLDTVGLFLIVVEAVGHAQTVSYVNIVREDGLDGGVQQNSESWLPYRAISGGYSATGTTGLVNLDAVNYKKATGTSLTTKSISPVLDLRELGRGLYSIRFDTGELDVFGSFLYTVNHSGQDQFTFFTDVVTGGYNSFQFNVSDNSTPMSGVYVDVRERGSLTFMGTVQTAASGDATALLPLGDYVATVRDGDKVFDENNHRFSVSAQSSTNYLNVDGANITSTLAASSPDKSTGTATFHNSAGEPISNLLVRVSMKVPQLIGSILHLSAKDFLSDENGVVSGEFPQGAVIEVTIERTNISREFEVPTSAFNLVSSALSVADPFTVATPSFPTAPTHTV